MSQLTDFYSGRATDCEGRTLLELQNLSPKDKELMHDYIQWLFPIPEASKYNPKSPLLTTDDVEAFGKDERLRRELKHSWFAMLDFYGLTYHTYHQRVVIDPDMWAICSKNWLTPGNHNFLRITRILRSMTLLGLKKEARAFYSFLNSLTKDKKHRDTIGKAVIHWRIALM